MDRQQVRVNRIQSLDSSDLPEEVENTRRRKACWSGEDEGAAMDERDRDRQTDPRRNGKRLTMMMTLDQNRLCQPFILLTCGATIKPYLPHLILLFESVTHTLRP